MPNNDRDGMNNDALVGIATLGALLFGGVAAAKGISNAQKKQAEIERRREQLKLQLQNVRNEISEKKSGLLGLGLGSIFNAGEIEELEAQEARILRELNELNK